MCDLGPDPLDGGARPRTLVPLLFHSAVSVLQVRFMIRKVAGGGVTHFFFKEAIEKKMCSRRFSLSGLLNTR